MGMLAHRVAASLRPGLLHDWPPQFLFRLDEAREVGREDRPERRSDLLDPGTDIRILKRLAEIIDQLSSDCFGCTFGCEECRPADRHQGPEQFPPLSAGAEQMPSAPST